MNFVFGSESDKANSSIILLCTFKGKALARVEAVPLDVNNYRVAYQPRVLTGKKAEALLGEINSVSDKFKARLTVRNGRGYLDLTAAAPDN